MRKPGAPLAQTQGQGDHDRTRSLTMPRTQRGDVVLFILHERLTHGGRLSCGRCAPEFCGRVAEGKDRAAPGSVSLNAIALDNFLSVPPSCAGTC